MTTDYTPDPARLVAPICVVIPTHPARGSVLDTGSLLGRAVASVRAQTLQPAAIVIVCDLNGDGAAITRQRALDEVETPYVSFLDSDDWLYPNHLAVHWALLQENYADVAYSWWSGNRPFSESTHRGIPFNNATPHHVTMTLTMRTELAKRVGFVTEPMHPEWAGEDWKMITGLAAIGAKFVGTAEETWHYAIHGGNSSGLAGRGDAQW